MSHRPVYGRGHMKSNKRKNPENKNRNQQPGKGAKHESNVTRGNDHSVERFLKEFTLAEKEFSWDLLELIMGFREGKFARMLIGDEEMSESLRTLLQRLAASEVLKYGSAEKSASQHPILPSGPSMPPVVKPKIFAGGGPARWRWN